VLAGKNAQPTGMLTRNCRLTKLKLATTAFHEPKEIEIASQLFFRIVQPTAAMVIDLDVTDDPVHGNQEQRFLQHLLWSVCYAPFYWSSSSSSKNCVPPTNDPANGH